MPVKSKDRIPDPPDDCNAGKAEWKFSLPTFYADCKALGIVGERNLALAIYIVGTSRLLDHPLAAIVNGKSSTGKSYLVSKVATLFPKDELVEATRMTPQALYHMEGSISHKFVVAGERSRIQDDAGADATAALRQLQSEGHITKQITEKGEGGKFTTQRYTVEGPIAYVETTTLDPKKVFPEDLNRAMLLDTDDSPEQTRRILSEQAARYGRRPRTDIDAIIQRHRDFQSRLQRRRISIPFADRLMDAIPATKVEARRAGRQVLSLVEAVTLLHQFEREQDEHECLLARIRDYAIAYKVLAKPLGKRLKMGTGAAAFYTKLEAEFRRKKFTTAAAQQLDAKAGERTVRGWLGELAEHKCVEQVAPAKGPKPATWQVNGKAPGDTLLPSPETIEPDEAG
jgi:hypothetical protein